MFELLLLATAIAEELADPCLGDAACYAELAAQGGTDAMAEEAVAEEAPAESEYSSAEEARATETAADNAMAEAAANGKIPILPQYKSRTNLEAPSNQLDRAIQALQQTAK